MIDDDRMAKLTDDQIRQGLAGLPGWALGEGEIEKLYVLADFRAAVAFIVRVAFEAEAAKHHPDIDVRWNRVRVALATHSEHAITTNDLELAAAIERLADT
jgi:4a-hydroxytetrahydrobiopterin dehydratase